MTRREARALFARERARFARVFPDVRRACLVIDDARCGPGLCRARDIAYMTHGRRGATVVLLARALALPRQNIVAVLRHELGHAADPRPGARGGEQRADDIAEYVTGQRIYYDTIRLQTTGVGTYPRPLSLHR